mmetsp:Transcript_6350/g.19098  ORF Transcript_6350/g.19098 Transcript_6350/m.19098 type:complete len:213 (-) Transcript_6350:2146-2784(-)
MGLGAVFLEHAGEVEQTILVQLCEHLLHQPASIARHAAARGGPFEVSQLGLTGMHNAQQRHEEQFHRHVPRQRVHFWKHPLCKIHEHFRVILCDISDAFHHSPTVLSCIDIANGEELKPILVPKEVRLLICRSLNSGINHFMELPGNVRLERGPHAAGKSILFKCLTEVLLRCDELQLMRYARLEAHVSGTDRLAPKIMLQRAFVLINARCR